MTNKIEQFWTILMRNSRYRDPNHPRNCLKCQQQHLSNLPNSGKLTLILPAFPAKSANRQKTISPRVDAGERLGLINLNALCQQLSSVHGDEVELIICSDGRVFNDLVLVDDGDVDIYVEGIAEIIQAEALNHLRLVSLNDFYETTTSAKLRILLMREFGEEITSLKTRIQQDPQLQYQFNGMHRFIIEDQLALHPGLSTNQLRKKAKAITYEVLRRSQAWSALLAKCYPNALRLSIHPQFCGSIKLGIQFLPAQNRWATPWHNVLLRHGSDWQLMKRVEAEKMGAVLAQDHYVLETTHHA